MDPPGQVRTASGPAGRPDRPRGFSVGGARGHDLARGRVEDEAIVASLAEIEHRQQGAGDGVEGAAADATEVPVVLNEAQDRALVGDGMIDKVLARERRDDQQRQAGPVAAAPS